MCFILGGRHRVGEYWVFSLGLCFLHCLEIPFFNSSTYLGAFLFNHLTKLHSFARFWGYSFFGQLSIAVTKYPK
jgi:hypothetical protein